MSDEQRGRVSEMISIEKVEELAELASPHLRDDDIAEVASAARRSSEAWSKAHKAQLEYEEVRGRVVRRVLDRISPVGISMLKKGSA